MFMDYLIYGVLVVLFSCHLIIKRAIKVFMLMTLTARIESVLDLQSIKLRIDFFCGTKLYKYHL